MNVTSIDIFSAINAMVQLTLPRWKNCERALHLKLDLRTTVSAEDGKVIEGCMRIVDIAYYRGLGCMKVFMRVSDGFQDTQGMKCIMDHDSCWHDIPELKNLMSDMHLRAQKRCSDNPGSHVYYDNFFCGIPSLRNIEVVRGERDGDKNRVLSATFVE